GFFEWMLLHQRYGHAQVPEGVSWIFGDRVPVLADGVVVVASEVGAVSELEALPKRADAFDALGIPTHVAVGSRGVRAGIGLRRLACGLLRGWLWRRGLLRRCWPHSEGATDH